MVETLDDILKMREMERQENSNQVARVQVFFTNQEARELLRIGQQKIKNSAWIIENLNQLPEEKRLKAEDNARRSSKFWENIASKIESVLK